MDIKKMLEYTDETTREMHAHTAETGVQTALDRFLAQVPHCGFGQTGLCCRFCGMGPCRLDPFGNGPKFGVCGADADNIVARSIARQVAVGCSSHSDHGREIAHILYLAATEPDCDYKITDEIKCVNLAKELGISVEGKEVKEVAKELAELMMCQFGQIHGQVDLYLNARAPKQRKEKLEKLGIIPRAIDREVVETLHRTHIGVDSDYVSILTQAMRCALANGWGGSMMATDLSDIIFGTPTVLETENNLGVLKEDHVNVAVHGHEPTLSSMVVIASRDPKVAEWCAEVGAKGVNIVGICCTTNEVLMRYGVPPAGSYLQQEYAMATGALDAYVTDVQCVFPSLGELTKCYHTKIFTTSPKAKMIFAEHIEFHEDKAYEIALNIVKASIDNYKNRRPEQVKIPTGKEKLVAGYSFETIIKALDGVTNSVAHPRGTVKPLCDAITSGVLRGAVAMAGCNNPHIPIDRNHRTITELLIKEDIIVVQTGCAALTCAKYGYMTYEAKDRASLGLKTVCELVGIPPVLHLGSCVDNSRIFRLVSACAKYLGIDIDQLPIAASAAEWMSEKAIGIGTYAIASGVFVHLGHVPQWGGAPKVTKLLTNDIAGVVGGKLFIEPDPEKAVAGIIAEIERKRKALGI